MREILISINKKGYFHLKKNLFLTVQNYCQVTDDIRCFVPLYNASQEKTTLPKLFYNLLFLQKFNFDGASSKLVMHLPSLQKTTIQLQEIPTSMRVKGRVEQKNQKPKNRNGNRKNCTEKSVSRIDFCKKFGLVN